MYITLFKVYCSSLSAVAACTFDCSMAKLLQTQRRIAWFTVFVFECDR